MSATPAVSAQNQIAGVLKLLALSAGLGVPVGAAAYGARRVMSPEPEIPSVTQYTDIPLIAGAGPMDKTRVKSAGLVQTLADKYHSAKGLASTLNPTAAGAAVIGGAGLGTGLGYGGTGALVEGHENADLDAMLAEREEAFNQLLLQEQMSAAGVKAAAVLDEVLDTIFDHAFEKSSSDKVDAAGAMAELGKSTLFPTLLALTGLYYGASTGWDNFVAGDKNRATAAALKSSLDQRLAGNPEGPRAPMIVKVRTDRIGATPIHGGSKPSDQRDVLSRL